MSHKYEKRLRKTPPRCLEGFKLRPSALRELARDDGELTVAYQLSCACGRDSFLVLGHSVENDSGTLVFVSPLALQCSACGKVTELIDTDQHGYDPELGNGSATIRGEGERTHFACDKCGVRPMSAHVLLEYADDMFEEPDEEFEGNEHNLFTGFRLAGECGGCGRVLEVADFECA